MGTTNLSVTLATCVMGRRDHIEYALPRTVASVRTASTEVLVLDYGSRDGLRKWIIRYFYEEMRDGRVTYVRMRRPPQHWRANHAKNVAALCSRGDIIVNVDADNWTGDAFDRSALHGLQDGGRVGVPYPSRASCEAGRLGFRLIDFVELGGYDEDMVDWGFTDADLRVRANCAGLQNWYWPKDEQGGSIPHGDDLRQRNGTASTINASFDANKHRSLRNIHAGRYRANSGRVWGYATVIVNEVKERTVGVLQDAR